MQPLPWEFRAYELSLPREKRKRLGQFFTEPAVARLLAALCITGPERRVLDAMAGHGSLLESAAERFALTGGRAELCGVEIDPETARLCGLRTEACVRTYGQLGSRIINGSAFSPAVWEEVSAQHGFDVVIGNPPYVRYQASRGRRDEVRDGLRAVADRHARQDEQNLWRALIDAYSGLADLSVPSWMLCSLLCREGGLLALVVPRTWMNRDYARLIRYIQLRFFRPLFIVEEHGVGWFEDALVPTTIVVSRRLPPREAAVPLHRRSYQDQALTRVAVPPSAGQNGSSLVSRAFPGTDPEGAFAAWIGGECTNESPLPVHREPLSEERSRVFALLRPERWFAALEAGLGGALPAAPADPRSLIPSQVAQAISMSALPNLVRLRDAGVTVGQGLRTGCNAFFYVDEVRRSPDGRSVTVRSSPLLGGREFDVPPEVLRPVLRRQLELSGRVVRPEVLRGRVLDLRGWLLPEDRLDDQGQLFQERAFRTMPEPLARYVRLAAKTAAGRNGASAPIPSLSAVAPNERAPGDGTIRRWYMLPDFAPRHLPLLFVPRVNDGTPKFIANASEPVLVDANFSTISNLGAAPSAAALAALLNSGWAAACVEAIGSPMGGGALKLEATHLRDLPVPLLKNEDWQELDRLGRAAAETDARTTSDAAVDGIVVAAILGSASGDYIAQTVEALTYLATFLQNQRQRKRGGYDRSA